VISSILKETQSAQYLADLRLSVADLYEAWRNVHLRLLNLGARGQRLCFVSQELLLRKETQAQLEGVIGAKLDQTFPDASLIRQRFEGTLDERTRCLFEALQVLAARPLAEQDAQSFQACLEAISAPDDPGPLSFPPRTSAEPARGPDALPVPISSDFLFPPSAIRALFYRLKEDQDALRTRADAGLDVSRQTTAKLGGLESSVERLASDFLEANRHATEAARPIGELLTRVEALEGSLADRDLELREIETRLDDTLSKLASESVAKDKRIATLESDLSSAHQRHLHDGGVITRLDAALDRERAARDAADLRVADGYRDASTLRDELTRERSRQTELRERLAMMDAEQRRLAAEVESRKGEVALRKSEIELQKGEVELRKGEVDALRREIVNAASTLAASDARAEDLRTQLEHMRSSHSWRVTAPLRAIRRWFGAR
jgi:DNA repair exonuclease SbcCD ATPase subunit